MQERVPGKHVRKSSIVKRRLKAIPGKFTPQRAGWFGQRTRFRETDTKGDGFSEEFDPRVEVGGVGRQFPARDPDRRWDHNLHAQLSQVHGAWQMGGIVGVLGTMLQQIGRAHV